MIVADLLSFAQPVESLVALEGNPRRGDIPAVAGSLERFGQRKPIVARSSDRVVIAGNHTLAAALSLGWSEIAVVFVDDDEATSKAYALADNRTGDLGAYDDEALLALLTDVPVLFGTGYSDEDLNDLIKLLAPIPSLDDLFTEHGDVTDEDLTMEVKVNVSKEIYLRWLELVTRLELPPASVFAKILDAATKEQTDGS